jgi:carboxypeptidase Taq
MNAYRALEERFARHAALAEATNVLHWDMSTMMPQGGAEARAEQLAALRRVGHDLLVDQATGDWLDAASAAQDLDGWQRANLREMRRMWNHTAALEGSLVEALTKACAAAETVWRRARPENDFKAVCPHLETVLRLVRDVGQAKAARLGCSAYDALLDEFEPGGRTAMIDPLFDDLAAFLPGFLERVLARQAAGGEPLPLDGPFSRDAQRALSGQFMRALGFDFDHGRLDESAHPFCGGVPDDVRITTRYDESDFTQGLMGVLHETGHALYERGLPASWRRQPVGLARGMSIHESQSLLVEMQACRSREFLTYAAPLLRAAFGRDGPAWSAENLYHHYTRVERGLIRVEADEVTYPAHVILRYRLERAMIEGDLAVADLPGAWREGMVALLGVVPPDDRQGCLQDIHWYDGAWGYFPTYTLGAMTAAQLFDAAHRALPDLPQLLAQGDFRPLIGWLGQAVHSQGSFLDTADLLGAATGRGLDPAIFRAHLERRYLI